MSKTLEALSNIQIERKFVPLITNCSSLPWQIDYEITTGELVLILHIAKNTNISFLMQYKHPKHKPSAAVFTGKEKFGLFDHSRLLDISELFNENTKAYIKLMEIKENYKNFEGIYSDSYIYIGEINTDSFVELERYEHPNIRFCGEMIASVSDLKNSILGYKEAAIYRTKCGKYICHKGMGRTFQPDWFENDPDGLHDDALCKPYMFLEDIKEFLGDTYSIGETLIEKFQKYLENTYQKDRKI